DFEKGLSRLSQETQPAKLRERVEGLLKTSEARGGEARRVWEVILSASQGADNELVAEAIRQVLASQHGPSGVKDQSDATVSVPFWSGPRASPPTGTCPGWYLPCWNRSRRGALPPHIAPAIPPHP